MKLHLDIPLDIIAKKPLSVKAEKTEDSLDNVLTMILHLFWIINLALMTMKAKGSKSF